MQKDLNKAVSVLQAGRIVVHATDTCYGFACDIFNKDALKRLYKLKQMPEDKPVSILVADIVMAQKYGVFNKKALALAQKYWPGPLTIVVKRKKTLPEFLNPGLATIGIRMPDHALSLALSQNLDRPITTTSANISGRPSPYSVSAIRAQFKNSKSKPDFIIDSGVLPRNPPSTIIDLSQKTPCVIRRGEISPEV